MKKEIGGCLIFLVLVLSGFVFAGSSSEINMTLIVSDDAVSGSVVDSSTSLTFWGMYGTYIVVVLILLIIFVLWMKGRQKGRRSQVAGRRSRRKVIKKKVVRRKKK